MANDGPNWQGLLKWSLAHSDGTQGQRDLRYFRFFNCCTFEGFCGGGYVTDCCVVM